MRRLRYFRHQQQGSRGFLTGGDIDGQFKVIFLSGCATTAGLLAVIYKLGQYIESRGTSEKTLASKGAGDWNGFRYNETPHVTQKPEPSNSQNEGKKPSI